jgi:hypothetical protein
MVVPDNEFGDPETSEKNLLDEAARSVLRQGAREPQKHDEVESALGEDLRLLTRRGQDGWRKLWAQDSQRMRLEGKENGARVRGVGTSPDLLEYSLMPKVYAIETPDGDHRPSTVPWNPWWD